MSDLFAFMSPAAVTGEAAQLRTPIERTHLAAGATLVPEGRWRIAHYENEPGEAWLADISHLAKLDVRGSSDQIDRLTGDAELGAASRRGEVWTMRFTPTWAVVVCPEQQLADERERSGAGVTDMSCGWAAVALGGGNAREVLMRSSALDVRPKSFPPGACRAGSVMRVPALVLNEDGERYRMLVGWEVGEYFWDAILDAGHNFAITPVSAVVALRREVKA